MLPTTTHPFVSAKADGPDATLVRPSNWNANHTHIGFPRAYLAGLGLSNDAGDLTNDISIAVGECQDSTNARDLILAATLVKRLDAAWSVGTNAGGLDTGVIANDTYHVHLIKRSDTGVVDAIFSLSATAPTMPTSYDFRRRIGSIVRTGGAIKAFVQDGDRFEWAVGVLDISAGNPGTAAVTRTLTTPTGITILALVYVGLTGTTTAQHSVILSDLAVTDTAPDTTYGNLTIDVNSGVGAVNRIVSAGPISVRTNTSAQIRSRLSFSDANEALRIYTQGWVDRRGRDA